MSLKRLLRMVVSGVIVASPVALLAQFTTPNVITSPPDAVTTTLGPTIFINQGLVGVGRISASSLDSFGESFGSMSSLQITGWTSNGNGTYSGTFNILPDRGYNVGAFFADYAARINRVGFTFTPYTGPALGGATPLDRLASQNQIAFTTPITGVKFTNDDPNTRTESFTTGLDPADFTTLFGQTLPYVTTFTGPQSPRAATSTTYTGINKLALDSEALILKADGSGYVGDEYGGNIYYFNAAKKIIGAIVPPAAFQPHAPAGTPNFSSASAPVNGRRNNQGFEGVALSPDGTRLFALLQSATVQDSNPAANDQLARDTRLLVYDVTGTPTPGAPIAEYVLVLPTYRLNGNGDAVNRTLAQSEVLALDNTRFLVLSRDGNGLGNSGANPSMFKSVLLVDTSIGNPTDISGIDSANIEGGKITTAPGVLDPSMTPLTWVEAVNMLNATQLGKFNIDLDTGGQVSKLTLGEKWEGLSLAPANDLSRPNDYFLFVGNDNDFLTSDGRMKGPDGTIISYNGFSDYPAARLPDPLDSPNRENDTVVLAFRVTIISGATSGDTTPPAVRPVVAGTLGSNGWYTSGVTVTWNVADPESGIVSLTSCGATTLTADTPGVTLTCTATNGAGLSASASVNVKIDRTPPAVTPPPNQTVPQTDTAGAVVDYPQPTVTDGGSGVATSSCLPASGTMFDVGTTTVNCMATDLAGNAGGATFTVRVKPAPDGLMFGLGDLLQGGTRHHFTFQVAQFLGHDLGRFEYRSSIGLFFTVNSFEASAVNALFTDNPAFQPGHLPRPTVDTVRISGVGRWNGRPGYTFEAVAADHGEPGRHRDTFALTVKDARGNVVVNVSNELDNGNIQSTRLGF